MMLKLRNAIVAGALLFSGLAANKDKHHSLDVDPDMRSVQGVVTYAAHEPVKGAVVKCEDTSNLEIRSYITDADGKYHFTNISVNHDYQLRAQKDHRESGVKRLTKFNTKKVATINLRLK